MNVCARRLEFRKTTGLSHRAAATFTAAHGGREKASPLPGAVSIEPLSERREVFTPEVSADPLHRFSRRQFAPRFEGGWLARLPWMQPAHRLPA